MIKESYKMPVDRPWVIWCRCCVKYRDATPATRANGAKWPPADLSTWSCNICSAVSGSMVYQFEVDDTHTQKWKPKCGNDECDGTCSNLLCIPPEYLESKVVEKIKCEYITEYKTPLYMKIAFIFSCVMFLYQLFFT
jgi:hypothetical protein